MSYLSALWWAAFAAWFVCVGMWTRTLRLSGLEQAAEGWRWIAYMWMACAAQWAMLAMRYRGAR